MSRLVDASQLLDRLQKKRAAFALEALDKADPTIASYEYGHKVGYNRGMAAAEQLLTELLKEDDNGRSPTDPTQQRPRYG